MLAMRSDRQAAGLGRRMLATLLEVARDLGIRRIWGDVMASNSNLLELTRAMGFQREPNADRELVRVATKWGAAPAPRPTVAKV